MDFDHIFIAVDNLPKVEEVCKKLIEAGFTQGSDNIHQGQGTANKRFFFQNAFIELLYPNPHLSIEQAKKELLSSTTQPTRLYERIFGLEDSSPFGICFRPVSNDSRPSRLPFETWHYCPEYLPKTMMIPVAVSPIYEPMWFYLDFAQAPKNYSSNKKQPLKHKNGCQNIASIEMTIKLPQLIENKDNLIRHSGAVVYLNELKDIAIKTGSKHQVLITFDKSGKNKQLELLDSTVILNF